MNTARARAITALASRRSMLASMNLSSLTKFPVHGRAEDYEYCRLLKYDSLCSFYASFRLAGRGRISITLCDAEASFAAAPMHLACSPCSPDVPMSSRFYRAHR